MLHSIKNFSRVILPAVLLAAGLQTSQAFSLLGPDGAYPGLPAGFGDAWQQPIIGFNQDTNGSSAGLDPLPVGPKNLGEQYRRNTPVMYYACDANFLNYFGASGSDAIDQAFALLNYSMTNNAAGNLNGYSAGMSEFPLNSESVNYQASALNLRDLKSETMQIMMEQLGLADPVRYTWCLHNRFQIPGSNPGCPFNMEYQVVMRNFDITATPLNQLQYSAYVNASFYTYFIEEVCTGPNPLAIAVPYLVNPLEDNPPVASSAFDTLAIGSFFTGLTRDDMAGLAYLLSTNMIAYEAPAAGSLLVSSSGPAGGTNYGAPYLLYTSDLTAFALAAYTNDPVTLSNLYPGLIITSTKTGYVVQYATNYYVAYYTNQIGAPIGSPQVPVYAAVSTPYVLTVYTNVFANVVTNHYNANSTYTLWTTNVQYLTGGTIGSPLKTNVTPSTVTVKGLPSGDFYINTNSCGPGLILEDLLTNVTYYTNTTLISSNSAGLYYSQSTVSSSNSVAVVIQPVVCTTGSGGGSTTTTNFPGLYEGIGKVQFVKTTYDSLIGQFYQPITNTYQQVLIVNSKPIQETFLRVVTVPDELLTAEDLQPGPSAVNDVEFVYARSLSFDLSTIEHNLAGPGVINNPQVVVFDKVGPVLLNASTAFLSGNTAVTNFIWASFDGSTNDPVVYPNGTSIANLGNQILLQISPSTLPAGTNQVAYPATSFVATGGAFSPPFTWSVSSGALPSGLTLSPGGTISGTPTQSGTFDFNLELTDSLSRTVTWSYSLIIN